MPDSIEGQRLNQSNNNKNWKTWGPYVSDRQWGTVREDYSANGNAWKATLMAYFFRRKSR